MKKKPIDWEAISLEYRAGVLSLSDIGHMHGVTKQAVQQKAKRLGWTQDLSSKVAALARTKLLLPHYPVDGVDDGVDGEIARARAEDRDVDEAAARVVEVVRRHRKDIARLNGASERLMEGLDKMLTDAEQDTPEKALAEGRKMHQMDLDRAARMVSALASVLAKLIPLERQAFNVDGVRTGEDQECELPASILEHLSSYNRSST
ncbi:MAG: hypothetical protein RDU24_13720 [Humidesulfovibrio sp.]|uniref:hypothetical protein n=1 Tax=Humidesulfovibrio sp. TaxID=2910988 RepID=UPI0027F39EFD|nr:hypothetical protein [Humidesulfovibrio sp.]MDQ7836434.1 hypothetical protein [Humidesulfovibrio sp.]